MPCRNDMIRTLVEAKSNEAEWSRQIPALLMQAQISSSRSNERVNIGIFGDVYGSQPLGRELIIRLARHLAKGYKGLDQEIVSLFSAANIYLFPMVDYEYFDTSNEGNCSSFLSKYSNLCIFSSLVRSVFHFLSKLEIYIQSAPNNSNETYTFMCLGRTGRFGQH